jgi:hypothetical protein
MKRLATEKLLNDLNKIKRDQFTRCPALLKLNDGSTIKIPERNALEFTHNAIFNDRSEEFNIVRSTIEIQRDSGGGRLIELAQMVLGCPGDPLPPSVEECNRQRDLSQLAAGN